MFKLNIPKTSLDDAIKFIERVTDLYDECYGVPRRAGVKGVKLANHETRTLYQALNYLTSVSSQSASLARQEIAAKIVTLTERLRALGKEFCFNSHGYHERSFEEDRQVGKIDFNQPLTHLNGIPYFIWRPEPSVSLALVSTTDNSDVDQRDRSLGIIYRDANGDEKIRVHGLTLYKSKRRLLKDDKADTRLDIEYNWSFLDGFNNRVTIFFKEGQILHVSAVDETDILFSFGKSGAYKFDSIEQALSYASSIIHVPEGLFAYYVLASNLTEEHKRDLGLQTSSARAAASYSFPLAVTERLVLSGQETAISPELEIRVASSSLNSLTLSSPNASTSSASAESARNYRLAEDEPLIDPDTLTPIYTWMEFANPTVDEFLHSQLPTKNYGSVNISFTSEKGNKYEVNHSINDKGKHGIQLGTGKADVDELKEIAEFLESSFDGAIEYPETGFLFDAYFNGRSHSIRIGLPEGSLSFESMKANFKGYRTMFNNVAIGWITVRNIKPEALATANLSLDERVKYEGCVLR